MDDETRSERPGGPGSEAAAATSSDALEVLSRLRVNGLVALQMLFVKYRKGLAEASGRGRGSAGAGTLEGTVEERIERADESALVSVVRFSDTAPVSAEDLVVIRAGSVLEVLRRTSREKPWGPAAVGEAGPTEKMDKKARTARGTSCGSPRPRASRAGGRSTRWGWTSSCSPGASLLRRREETPAAQGTTAAKASSRSPGGNMGFFDKAKQMAEEAAAKAKAAADDLQEKAAPTLDKAKAEAAELAEKAKPHLEQAKQEASELAQKASDALKK